MAKRSNPYSEDFTQQSKVHVGIKQFNNNEDRLKKVYEKTLMLLYQGAKKKPQNDVLQCPNISSTEKKGFMKQLFIGKNGGLLHSGTLVKGKSSPLQQCVCRGPGAGRCSYCEDVLCPACQHQCAVCQQMFCSKCSLIGSEASEVCVSCYS